MTESFSDAEPSRAVLLDESVDADASLLRELRADPGAWPR